MTSQTNSQESISKIGVNTPFDQDKHDFAYVVKDDQDIPDNVHSIHSAPSLRQSQPEKPSPEAIDADPINPHGTNRLKVAQKASEWLLGGTIDRTPSSTAVASAKRRQIITDQTRKLSERGF